MTYEIVKIEDQFAINEDGEPLISRKTYEDARKLAKRLSAGAGFNGKTPGFFKKMEHNELLTKIAV
jgi:hypothetical protein